MAPTNGRFSKDDFLGQTKIAMCLKAPETDADRNRSTSWAATNRSSAGQFWTYTGSVELPLGDLQYRLVLYLAKYSNLTRSEGGTKGEKEGGREGQPIKRFAGQD
jgi:hypothetical protein